MKGTVIVLLALAGMVLSDDAEAGPFGLEMGMKLEDLGGQPKALAGAKGIYLLSTVPKPHSAFESYAVLVTPKAGLCKIQAIGKNIQTNSFGFELKSQFKEMQEKLGQLYGKFDTTDVLLPGSIWNEPKDFMMGIVKEERTMWSVWDAEYKSKLTENVQTISLKARATSANIGFLQVQYEFKNLKDCSAEMASEDDGAL